MNLSTFGFLFFGICLNAVAQLLLKAGANAVGAIHLTSSNWFPTLIKLGMQWPIIGGLSCYVVSVLVWIIGLSRVDVTIAHAHEEARRGGDHLEALKHAPETDLPISEGGLHILRAMRP